MLPPGFCQIQRQLARLKMFQASFKVAVAIHRHSRRQLDSATLKPLEVRSSKQFAIQPRRRHLQNIGTATDCVLNIQDRAHLTAQAGAIFMRHALRLVYEDAQHARLAPAAEKHPPSKKWACAHWCVPPNPGTTQQFQSVIYARTWQKTNQPSPVQTAL